MQQIHRNRYRYFWRYLLIAAELGLLTLSIVGVFLSDAGFWSRALYGVLALTYTQFANQHIGQLIDKVRTDHGLPTQAEFNARVGGRISREVDDDATR